jgi:hypothetical protein
MENSERLEVLTTPSRRDGVRLQLEQTIQQMGKEMDLRMRQVPHVESAIEALKNGDCDLIALSAYDWREFDTSGLFIAGVLPRREPTWVLVSDDKPEYLIGQPVIVCDHPLLHRQFLRVRFDSVIMTSEGFAQSIDKLEEYNALHADERVPWLEELRKEGKLDGYIVTRGEHQALPFKARRHTLGLQRDNPERSRFVPPPLNGFTLMVARRDFPSHKIESWCDSGAFIAHRMETAIWDSLPENISQIVGVFVEQRKVSTILREAKRANDEQITDSILDLNKKVKNTVPRLEMKIEILDPLGMVSAAAERVCPVADSHMGMVTLLKEFNILLDTLSSEHEELAKHYHGLPKEFSEAKPAMLDLGIDHSDSSVDED